MKRNRVKAVLFLLAFCLLFSSCEMKSTEKWKMKFVYPEKTAYCYTPPNLCGEEIIISGSENSSGNPMTTASVCIKTEAERNLQFVSPETVADDTFYYWVDWEAGYLMRTEKETLKSERLERLEQIGRMTERLSIDGNCLFWLEGTSENEWGIQKYDLAKQESSTVAVSNPVTTPYAKMRVYDGWIVYPKNEEQLTVIVCNTNTGESQEYEVPLQSMPNEMITNGEIIAWTSSEGVSYFSLKTKTVTKVEQEMPASGIQMLKDRYLVYACLGEIYLYDIRDNKVVFETDPNDSIEYLNYFNTDLEHTRAIFSVSDINAPAPEQQTEFWVPPSYFAILQIEEQRK